jgi:hypothetical protein
VPLARFSVSESGGRSAANSTGKRSAARRDRRPSLVRHGVAGVVEAQPLRVGERRRLAVRRRRQGLTLRGGERVRGHDEAADAGAHPVKDVAPAPGAPAAVAALVLVHLEVAREPRLPGQKPADDAPPPPLPQGAASRGEGGRRPDGLQDGGHGWAGRVEASRQGKQRGRRSSLWSPPSRGNGLLLLSRRPPPPRLPDLCLLLLLIWSGRLDRGWWRDGMCM